MKKILIPISALISLTSSLMAIQIDNQTSATNDRFSNNSNFIANDIDLSGVGISNNSTWATMVSENVFLSANHFHPNTGNIITFYAGNDPLGSSITRTVSGGQRIGTTDIWVGTLDSPIAPGYAFYDIALSSNIGQSAYLTGRSANSIPSAPSFAIGRNTLEAPAPTDPQPNVEGSTANAILASYTSSALLPYESLLQGGDSGAPLFVHNDFTNETTLVGTNWIVAQASFLDSNGFTDLSADRAAIQTIIDANAVPEPSSITLFSLASLLLITKRRR
ncbi:MAG: PEP-CTERM sorting domain-containing protein [Akkermansiaceae bacterium]